MIVTGVPILKQCLDQVGAAFAHALGELLDRDRLGHIDVADLLGRGAGFHVMAPFLFAGAAERGKRAGAAFVFVGKRTADRQFATLALFVAATARAAGLGPPWRRGMAAGGAMGSAIALPIR